MFYAENTFYYCSVMHKLLSVLLSRFLLTIIQCFVAFLFLPELLKIVKNLGKYNFPWCFLALLQLFL